MYVILESFLASDTGPFTFIIEKTSVTITVAHEKVIEVLAHRPKIHCVE